MSKGTRIELPEGELAKLKGLLRGKEKQINEAANTGLNRVAMSVLADAQKNLKDKGSIATSQLINSGRIKPQTDMSIDVSFEANHAYWVEYGRKAGGMPPIKPILEWIKKKGIADKTTPSGARKTRGKDFLKEATSLAYAIAKSIARFGTKAKPFLFPAFRKNEANMMRVIDDAIKKVL